MPISIRIRADACQIPGDARRGAKALNMRRLTSRHLCKDDIGIVKVLGCRKSLEKKTVRVNANAVALGNQILQDLQSTLCA
jgi:hypothetical protein